MTRCNIGILPEELADSHLIAELRELPRVRALMLKRIEKYGQTPFPIGPVPELPTLGKGHVSFFLPYGKWLKARYLALQAEAAYRGFKSGLEWREVPEQCQQADLSWEMEQLGRRMLAERINERLLDMTPAKIRWTKRPVPLWVDRDAAAIADLNRGRIVPVWRGDH